MWKENWLDYRIQELTRANNPACRNFGPICSEPGAVEDFLFKTLQQWDTANVEIKFPSVENPEVSKVLPL